LPNRPATTRSARSPQPPGGFCRGLRPPWKRARRGRRGAARQTRQSHQKGLPGRHDDGGHSRGHGAKPPARLANRPQL